MPRSRILVPILDHSFTPSAPEEFGPTDGAQAVRDGVGPRGSITVFAGTAGVDFTQLNPASSQATNQAAITADTTGKIWWPAGYYRLTSKLSLDANTEYRFQTGPLRTSADTAIITGSAVVSSWTAGVGADTGRWYATGQTQDFTSASSNVLGASSNAAYAPSYQELEDYWSDGNYLYPVTTKAAVDGTTNRKYMDRAADTVWIGFDPSGHTIERLTFFDHNVETFGANVTIRGGIFEHGGYSVFVLDGSGGGTNADNGLIEDVEFRYGHLRTIHFGGVALVDATHSTAVQNFEMGYCSIHHGGRYAMQMHQYVDANLHHCEFYEGNFLHFGDTNFNDEGCFKFGHTVTMHFHHNWCHDNDGAPWWDYNNHNLLAEENVLEDNWGPGLWYEVSLDGVIRRNLFTNNGRTDAFAAPLQSLLRHLEGYLQGLFLSASPGCETDRNMFIDNNENEMVIRGSGGRSNGHNTDESVNELTHHNYFEKRNYVGGGWGDAFISSYDTSSAIRTATKNNTADYNEYHSITAGHGGLHTWWYWGGSHRTFAQWQAGDAAPEAGSSAYDPNGTWAADL